MNTVESATLRLEPQTAAHAEAMFELLCDPALYLHEGAPPPSLAWLRERFERLESRRSADGTQQWLNWVVRLPSSALAGYVQATVDPPHRAAIAYVLHSRYWGRGLAFAAVALMIDELAARHGVQDLSAVFKRSNERSHRLLLRLRFGPASDGEQQAVEIEADEAILFRRARPEDADVVPHTSAHGPGGASP